MIATSAPKEMMFAAQSMPAPSLRASASGASWPLSLSNGSAPVATMATRMYSVVAISSEPMIARGRSRLGSLTSSLEVETASKPM